MAVTAGMGCEVVAFAENDPYAARVFSSHHPGAPNLGDITEADWAAVRDEFSPTVIAAGFPCRNISNAGDRTGIEGEFSRVWKNVAEAVGVVRPRYVFLENVAAILRRGIDTVAGDLAGIGYDARWTCLRASDPEVGACHPRHRWFAVAYPADADTDSFGWNGRTRDQPEPNRGAEPTNGRDPASLPTPTARDWKSGASNLIGANARPFNEVVVNLLPTPKASDGPHRGPNQRDTAGNFYMPALAVRLDSQWIASTGKDYGPAIRRWEHLTGRPAPEPTEAGTKGNRRLSPAFAEWMMGLPAGWVTDVPGIPRKEQIRMLGNGVVWQQAHEGYTRLFAIDTEEMDDMSTETEPKKERPKGQCTGCAFDYTLSLARSGEFKGQGVIRKHNSRTGPGLCSGAQKPPKSEGEYPVSHDRNASDSENPGISDAAVHPGDGVSGVDGVTEQGLWADQREWEAGESSPVDVSALGGGDPGRDVSGSPVSEHEVRGPGSSGAGDVVGEHAAAVGGSGAPQREEVSLPQGTPVRRVEHSVRDTGDGSGMSHLSGRVESGVSATAQGTMMFADPAPMPAELPPVSGQPEPDRDRWSRYLIHGQPHTRATTFAKLGSSTFALGEWNERMLIKGLVERPDLLALAHGLDVKRDKKQLNGIADDAQTHAGNKVAANIGTAYHAFTERLDAGLITLADVPDQYRARCEQYVNALQAHGLTTRAEWIERTTAVRADQVSAPAPVAGTLDRIFQLPNGELVIGDLKTGSDLSYGFVEIAVQLAIYAHGVNTFGLFDWNSKSWGPAVGYEPGEFPVRTDYAIVMHLPADGDGCTLYRVDLVKGWKYAQVSGEVQTRQKDKSVAGVLVPGSLGPAQAAAPPPATTTAPESMMERASRMIDAASHVDELITLLGQAGSSGRFTPVQMEELKGLCAIRWQALQV